MWANLPSKLSDRIIPEPTSGCWIWLGSINVESGYGYVTVDRKTTTAHRAIYELIKGKIPKGLHIDHLCRNRICCNPDHLEPVTPGENARRGETGKYQLLITHCPRGHPYNDENTYFNGRSRACRACNLITTWRRRGKL